MVELLFKNADDVHSDPDIDRMYSLKRGDLVYAQDTIVSGYGWNDYETLPEFSRLILSDGSISGIQTYFEPWYLELGYETLSYNDVEDIYVVRMFSNTPGIGEIGPLHVSQIFHHLENWNLTLSGVGSNEVIFEADMKNVFSSRNFWNGITDGLIITPMSFDSQTKVHTLKINYAGFAPGKSRTDARLLLNDLLAEQQITVSQESLYANLVKIEIPSLVAVNKFITQMTTDTRKVVFARRYYVNSTAMNAIENYMQTHNGEPMTTDGATLINYVNDRLLEY